MQRLIATDGVEITAGDFQHEQDGKENAIRDRTQLWAGTNGVFAGGVVSSLGGLSIAISGPLQFQANGELGTINAPANQLVANGATNYVIAKYGTVDSVLATYYGTASPPFIRRSDNPTIVVRTSGPASLGAGEANLATVTASGGAITLITDTRIVLPSVSNGNILLGNLKTIDGVDPSVHVATVATNAVLGHVLLGAAGGAARFEDVPGAAKYWIVELYVKTRSNGFLPDDSDFDTPPGGITVTTWRDMTYDGSHMREGSGPEYNWRLTLNFTSSANFNASARILSNDDAVRVKLNGSTIYSTTTSHVDLNTAVTLPVVIGANTLKLFFCNGGGSEWRNNLFTSLLLDNRITFNPL
jgi:hypothetical protein